MQANIPTSGRFPNLKSKCAAGLLPIMAGLLFWSGVSRATTLSEDFDYNTAWASLNGLNGGSGFSGGWLASGTSYSVVGGINLTYSNGGYAIVQTNSNSFSFCGALNGVYRGATRFPSTPLTNIVWFSAVVVANPQTPSEQAFVGFNSSGTNASHSPYAYQPSDGYNIGISNDTLVVLETSAQKFIATTNSGLTPGATHVILGCLTFQAYGAKDALQIWADPADFTHLGAPQWQEVALDIGTNLFDITVGAYYTYVDAIRFSDGNGNETNAYTAVTGTTNLNPFTPPPVPPPAPTGLSAAAGNVRVTLNWNAVAAATSYNVYRSLISGGSYAVVTNQAGTTFADAGVVNGQTYFYVVTALNANGESTYSAEVSATPAVTNQFAADDFNYPSGSLQSLVCNGGTGWAGAWATDASTTHVLMNGTSSLTYTNGGYGLVQSNVSGSFYADYTAYRGTQRTLATPASGGVWFSALLLAPTSAAQAYLGFNSANTNNYFPSTTYSFGLSGTTLVIAYGASTSSGNWSSFVNSSVNNLAVGQAHLLLGNITVQPNSNAVVQLWVDPANLTLLGDMTQLGPPAWTEATHNIGSNLWNVCIGGVSSGTVDAVRVSGNTTAYTDVTGATNPYAVLKFGDEFNGSAIDTSVWQLGDGYTVPGGRTNVSVSGGSAHFNIGYDGANWLTGWISTKNTVHKYGIWVSRYRLAQANGLNNAFWTATAAANKSFDDIEIDINEGHWPYSTDNTLTSHIWNHCVTPNVATLAYGAKPAYDWTQYHTNVLEWRTDNSLHFFLDGVEYTSSTQGLNNAGVMGPQKLIFSTMYGTSHGPGTGLTNTSMDVDYVRLYQKPGWGGSASGSWTNAANWGPDGVPATNVAAVFNQATTNTTITLPSDKWCQSLYFDMPTTPSLTLAAGNTLHLGCTNSTGRGGIILGDSLTTPQNINVNLKGETELEFGNYSSSGIALYLNGRISSSPGESNVFFLGRSWSPAIYVNGQLDASMHNLTLDYGSLWLNASNALTGTIYVNSSTLFVGANSALGNHNESLVSGSVVLTSNVNYTASHTLHLLSSGYGGYSPLDVLNSTNVTFAGAISCEGAASGIGSKIPVGGVLRLTGPISLNGNTLTFQGSGAISIEGYCASASGTCNFQCATLAGTGVLDGPTTIADGKTLAPGGWSSPGTLTINNSLTLGGPSTKTIFRLSKDGGQKCDNISGLTWVNYAGSLIVTNIGSTPLAAGDTFQLFSASSYGGDFSTLTLPALAAPLAWDTSNLSIDGSIAVTGPTNPVIQPIIFDGSGTNLLLRVATQSGYNYILQTTTNLTSPVVWVSQFTNNGSGLTVTNAIPACRNPPKCFYRYTVQ